MTSQCYLAIQLKMFGHRYPYFSLQQEEEISKIIKSKQGLTAKAYMGLVMAKFKGQLNPKKAIEIIQKLISK